MSTNQEFIKRLTEINDKEGSEFAIKVAQDISSTLFEIITLLVFRSKDSNASIQDIKDYLLSKYQDSSLADEIGNRLQIAVADLKLITSNRPGSLLN